MEDILQDTNKFKPLLDDPVKTTIKRENKIRTFLKELKKTNTITDEQLKQLSPTGSRPGIIYGLPKVHKTNIPLRPISSAIGTHSYNLAKFLFVLLRPLSLK